MLTTVDNPFDPFTRWKDWLNYDISHDNGCCEIVGRLAATCPDSSPASNQHEYECAIDNFVNSDATGFYKKVTKELDDEEVSTTN